MLRYGISPFLECSSKGDVRFSAFFAKIKSRGNRSIEDIYQSSKIFEYGVTNLSWKEAKGRRAINQPAMSNLYSVLWDEYIAENPELIAIINNASGFSDMFGQEGHCCQATELYRIQQYNFMSKQNE